MLAAMRHQEGIETLVASAVRKAQRFPAAAKAQMAVDVRDACRREPGNHLGDPEDLERSPLMAKTPAVAPPPRFVRLMLWMVFPFNPSVVRSIFVW